VELDPLVWGPVLTGAAALAWIAFGKDRPKAPASAAPARADGSKAAKGEPKSKSSPRPTSMSTPDLEIGAKPAEAASSGPKAIVWEQPPGERADDDITVLHAIPVFDRGAEISIGEAHGSNDGDLEEDRVSRIELHFEEDAEAEEVTAASARILLYAAGDSDQGRVRTRNEDSLLVMPERSLFAVADGMGGHRGGEVASSLAIDALQDAFDRSAFEGRVQADGDVPRRARELAAAVQMTNECVRSMALADRELSDMGTTLVAARFSPNKQRLYVGHVGDSRCYRLRRGTLRQLTTDHTMATLGMKGPRSQDLFQAVGTSPGLMIDLIVDKPQDDDVYLLCSDGLSKMLSDDKVRDVLLAHEDLESALYTLIEEANNCGGKDNVTVIIVKVLSRTSKKAIETLTKQAVTN
jgi:protein phosphatase